MTLPAASTDEPFESPPENHESFKPIDRTELSESALSLLDRYRIENANDPMAIFITIVDTMNARQREAISHFEAAIALAGVEFGRIDLALEKAEETQKRVETLANVLERLQKGCILVTSQTREPSKFAPWIRSSEAVHLQLPGGDYHVVGRDYCSAAENSLNVKLDRRACKQIRRN